MPTPSNDSEGPVRGREIEDRRGRRQGGTPGDDIVLVAVTKNASIDVVRQLLAARAPRLRREPGPAARESATQVGEFRQRLVDHPEAAAGTELVQPRWHMIGQLQRNKVRKLVEHVRLIHSVDSMRLAEEIQAQGARATRRSRVLRGEPRERARRAACAAPAVRHVVDQVDSMLNVKVRGSWAWRPSPTTSTSSARPSSDAATLRGRSHVGDSASVDILSMGMSNDFEIAVECGANVVRVGTALVGDPIVEEPEERTRLGIDRHGPGLRSIGVRGRVDHGRGPLRIRRRSRA